MRKRVLAAWVVATALNVIAQAAVMGISPVYAAECTAECLKPANLTCICTGREAECDAADCVGCGATDADGCSVNKTCGVC
jgi:hypothetical protein